MYMKLELISPLDCHSRSLSQWDELERCSRHRLEERQKRRQEPEDYRETIVNVNDLKDLVMKAGATEILLFYGGPIDLVIGTLDISRIIN